MEEVEFLNKAKEFAIELSLKMNDQKDLSNDIKYIKQKYKDDSINIPLLMKAIRRLIQIEKNPEEEEQIQELVGILKESSDLVKNVKTLIEK